MEAKLNLDMDAVKGWRANAVLSLIEDHEFEMLGVPELGEAVKAREIEWFHFPIWDLDNPTDDGMGTWTAFAAQPHATVRRDGHSITPLLLSKSVVEKALKPSNNRASLVILGER